MQHNLLNKKYCRRGRLCHGTMAQWPVQLCITHPSDHSHLCSLKCHLVFRFLSWQARSHFRVAYYLPANFSWQVKIGLHQSRNYLSQVKINIRTVNNSHTQDIWRVLWLSAGQWPGTQSAWDNQLSCL